MLRVVLSPPAAGFYRARGEGSRIYAKGGLGNEDDQRFRESSPPGLYKRRLADGVTNHKMSLIYRPNLFETLFRDMERLERGIAPYWLNSGDNLQLGETSQEVVNDDNKFGVALDVSQFKPEELKVNLDGRLLTIEASHERKDQDNYMKR